MKIWSPTAPCKALLKLEGPGGPAVEKIIDITEANKWVEYTFDLSGGASLTNLKTILVSFNSFVLGDAGTYYFDDIVAYKAETCYETFEGASGINWTGLNGTFDGAIANPGANQVNSSATVGSFTNAPAFDYNFAFGTLASGTMNLTTLNQFKMNVWSPTPIKVLFKLEGTGESLEKIKYLAVGNAWQELTFDMSAAANMTTINKILIVFNPGVAGDNATYYFDNICATPNACTGITADPKFIDDFECNRNAAYALGWDSLSVVSNPHINGDNNTTKVGKWNDPAGAGTEYAALVIDNGGVIDLSQNNQFSCQVWAPKTGTLLLKIEGGVSAKEYPVPVTEANKWVNYSVDFSTEAGEGHRKFVIFFNAGVNGEPGDVYYIDNIRLTPPTAAPPLEDFQGAVHLGWQPLDQNDVLHGVFTGPTPNPNPNSVNSSTEVGCYAKGVSGFSTLQAISLTNFDLSTYGQFNLDVLSPAAGGSVRLQLSSPTQGNKEADADITTPGQWETLKFDFSAFSGVTDFGEIRIIFNPGSAAAGESWCVDNLRQTELTIDPCAGTVPLVNVVDDFECQRNYTQIFYGASDISVVNNPYLTPDNGSLKVGEYKDPAGAGTEFAGIGFEFPASPDFSVYNHLSMQVYSPNGNVPFLFKLEGGTAVEVFDTLTTANKWHKFDIDFTNALGKNNTKLVIFCNVLSATGGGTYYFDNIKWQRAGYSGCIVDNQTPTLVNSWTYFANGHLETEAYGFEIVDNPSVTGINTSPKVGKFVKASDALPFAGMYSNPNLEAPIDWKGQKTMRAKVYMDHIGNLGFKVEGSATGASALELKVPNTKTNEWEELTFDFSAVPDNGEYQRLTLFFDLGIDATGTDVTSYFDDIIVGAGACGMVDVFTPSVPVMRMVPNPAVDKIWVEHLENATRLDIYNALGQRVSTVSISNENRTDIDISRLTSGIYHIAAYNFQGALVGNGKFCKAIN